MDHIGFLGLIPNLENNGGYITQIATQFFGDNRNILQTTDEGKLIAMGINVTDIRQTAENNYATNPDKTIIILPDQASIDEAKATGILSDYKIYITEDAAKSITHVFTNGILNSSAEALANGYEQMARPSLSLVNYNPTHGFFADGAETLQDKWLVEKMRISIFSTGSAKQTGEIINQMTDIREGNIAIIAHSQGTGLTYAGMSFYDTELQSTLTDLTTTDFKVGFYGSPIGVENSSALVNSLYSNKVTDNNKLETYFRSSVNPGDPVGTFPFILGGSGSGINNPSMSDGEFGYMWSRGISSIANGKDPTNPSPHSGYVCVIGCGDQMKIPDKTSQYFKINGTQDALNNFYNSHHLKSNFANFNQLGDKNGKD